MIVVRLMGGLGNQMFQYAFGRALSIKYNRELKIDLSFLTNRNRGSNFVYRNYELDIFNIENEFYNSDLEQLELINEVDFDFSEDISEKIGGIYHNKNILLDGHWASFKYFSEFESQIRRDFTFKNTIENSDQNVMNMLSMILETESVLINVRRTDFLNSDFHGVMGMDYINKSKKIIEEKVNNPHYFIFSDDIDWCRENLKENNMTIVDHSYKGDRFSYYLQLMSSCKNFIIPNSTFAWWAAWLNNNLDKIVISPKIWLNSPNLELKDLTPHNWIRV